MEIIPIIAIILAALSFLVSWWAAYIANQKYKEENTLKKSALINVERLKKKGYYDDLIISNIGLSDAKNIHILSKTNGIVIDFENTENPYKLLCSNHNFTIKINKDEEINTAKIMLIWDDNHKKNNRREIDLFVGLA